MSLDVRNKPTGVLSRVPLPALLAGALVAAIAAISLGVALYVTSKAAYIGEYKSLKRSYVTLQSGGHRDLACTACHAESQGPVLVKAAQVGDFYRNIVGRPNEPTFAKLGKPSREKCLACHEQEWSDDAKRTMKIPHPAHLRVADEERDCVKCHKWTAHEEEYMEKHKTMKFSSVCASYGCHVGTKQKDDCASCHHSLTNEKQGVWKVAHAKTVRSSGPNGCLESCHDAKQCRMCHTTGKKPDFKTNIAATGVKAIEREHVKQDWMQQHGTMALADEAKCLVCHVSVGECEDCHAKRPAFHGLKSTWLGRHKDLAKDENERRCLACHEKSMCEDCHKQFKEMR